MKKGEVNPERSVLAISLARTKPRKESISTSARADIYIR
jgi:hypothetical protein